MWDCWITFSCLLGHMDAIVRGSSFDNPLWSWDPVSKSGPSSSKRYIHLNEWPSYHTTSPIEQGFQKPDPWWSPHVLERFETRGRPDQTTPLKDTKKSEKPLTGQLYVLVQIYMVAHQICRWNYNMLRVIDTPLTPGRSYIRYSLYILIPACLTKV